MFKRNKRTVLLCLVMVVVLIIGSLAAYFTDSDSKVNKFLIGNLKIELTEPLYEQNGGNGQTIIPKETIIKDPTLTLKDGSVDAFIYATVSVPAEKIALYNDDGSKIEGSENNLNELFSYTVNPGWYEIGTITKENEVVHVYVWGDASTPTTVTSGNSTSPIFDSVTFANIKDEPTIAANNHELDIVVNGYGIQAKELGTDDSYDVWDLVKGENNFDDTGIELTAKDLTLSVDGDLKMGSAKSYDVQAFYDGNDVTNKVDWASSDESKATVTNGRVETKATAQVGDQVTITASSDNPTALTASIDSLGILDVAYAADHKEASFTVTIVDITISDDSTDAIDEITIIPGNSKTIKAVIEPATDDTVSWSVNKPAGIDLYINGNTVEIRVDSSVNDGGDYQVVATYGTYSKIITLHTAKDDIVIDNPNGGDKIKNGGDNNTINMGEGDTATIVVGGDVEDVEITSDDEDVVKVKDDNQTLEAVGEGTANITVSAKDNKPITIVVVVHHTHVASDSVRENEVAATCTEAGSYDEVFYCAKNHDHEISRTQKTIEALGHNWVEKSRTDSTCVDDGIINYECSRCGETKSEAISAKGHDFGDWVIQTAATCTTTGFKVKTCSRCDATISEEIPIINHTESDWIIDKEETCEEDGSKHKECTVCHTVLETVVIDEISGHNYVNGTCTNCGDKLPNIIVKIDGSDVTEGITLETGEEKTLDLSADITGKTLDDITITSSNPDVVKPVKDGDNYKLVAGDGEGTATITITAINGNPITIPVTVESAYPEAGLYNDNDEMVYSWQELINKSYIDSSGKVQYNSGKTALNGELVIPNSITSIQDYAFQDCKNLTSVIIPNSVESIGKYAFYRCSSLQSIIIGNNVISIGDSAFNECTSLTSVTIPNSVTSIGSSAFAKCTNLASATISSNVTNIGTYNFSGCSNLTSVIIPNGVISIGTGAFSNCTSLTSIGLKGSAASIEIPDSVTSIGLSAFSGCSSLTSVILPDSVESLGTENTFKNCTNLTSVIIPNSVTNIGTSVFDGCTSLTSISSKGSGASVEIPDSVTSIGNSAFKNCTNLTSVIIPDGVTSIDIYAFGNCSGLISTTIGNSVTSIGVGAFNNCTNLTSATFKNPSGWYVTSTKNATSGTNLTLTDTTQNATYFTSTHVQKYWYRK